MTRHTIHSDNDGTCPASIRRLGRNVIPLKIQAELDSTDRHLI